MKELTKETRQMWIGSIVNMVEDKTTERGIKGLGHIVLDLVKRVSDLESIVDSLNGKTE